MNRNTLLSPETDVLVDANIFIAIGHPTNQRYKRFRQAVQAAGVVLKLPHLVIGEIGGLETDRVRLALEEGLAEVINAPAPTDGDAVAARDIARQVIANETGRLEHVKTLPKRTT
jgi:hypothetical protein